MPVCPRSHALRGNACSDALRRVLKSVHRVKELINNKRIALTSAYSVFL